MTTSVVYTSQTGSVTDYSIPFDYLSQDHVKVTLDGVATTSFSFLSASLVRMDAAPSGDLRIYRETPTSTSLVTWTDGSILLDNDLNLGNLQMLYVAEEVITNSLSKTLGGNWNGQGLRFTNLAAGTEDGDAVIKSQLDPVLNQAQSQLDAANSALTAVSDAETVLANAISTLADIQALADAAAVSAQNAESAADGLPTGSQLAGMPGKKLIVNDAANGYDLVSSLASFYGLSVTDGVLQLVQGNENIDATTSTTGMIAPDGLTLSINSNGHLVAQA